MVRSLGAVELARAHERARVGGQPLRQTPRVTTRRGQPQVERSCGHRDIEIESGVQDVAQALEAAEVALPLFIDVHIVGEGHRGRRLDRPGHHESGVLAELS